MKWTGLNELRETFLEFFVSKGHTRLPSAPLVPQDEASLLLINSGMAPLKKYFTRQKFLPNGSFRATSCQKCIRTPDIENVGKTARHGTYFEMLGNFSFGDYFKEDATRWAWEFITEKLELPVDKLYVSVYQDDDEAYEIWTKRRGVAPDHMVRLGKEDNFWEHGAGPCGPCSEIYYDRGPEYGCGKPDCTVGCDCDRYMEIWNNVFTQFDNDGQNHYTELKQKNIDTGMGLERLACVIQGVDSLFEVDTVMNITHKVSEITGAHYGESHQKDVSLRVITDHIRSSVFMICDGILPSNEGRGYVLRRLLRRAARHGKLLGVSHPFLYDVVDTVIHENECHYPELRERQSYITRVIKVEEENFAKTIDGGMKIYQEMLSGHRDRGETVFSGADAFKLYDTYGFPVDLTREMAEEEGLQLEQAAFDALMQEQKVRAREARKALGDLGWAGVEFGKEIPDTVFVGYEHDEAPGKLLAIAAEGELREEIAAGTEAILVLDQTPMYAEMGGQVADHGQICGPEGVFEVIDVQKNKGGKYMHSGVVRSGVLKVGDAVTASIDPQRRKAIRRAHSATHLLDRVLRDVLGEHVHQAGSLVEPDKLRFDFTHFSALTPEELAQVSARVNQAVLEGYPIVTEEMPIDEARKRGAIALFGEKYGERVRVVDMGQGFSVEFCGGTHLDNTAKVGVFHIESEFSVASGVRRIEAITGQASLDYMNRNQAMLYEAASILKAKPAELRERALAVMSEQRQLQQLIEKYKSREAASEAERFLFGAREVGGVKVITATIPEADAGKLRQMGDIVREKAPNVAAVLATVNDGKITFLACCGKNAVEKGVKAGDIIKTIAPICGGKGGGKPDSAMGGGSDLLKLDDAMAAVDNFVASKLGL